MHAQSLPSVFFIYFFFLALTQTRKTRSEHVCTASARERIQAFSFQSDLYSDY